MHDLWLENTKAGSFKRRLAEQWEPEIFRHADKMICMTEHQLQYYKEKYPRQYEVVPHCVKNIDNTVTELVNRLPAKNSETVRRILYTGNISTAMNLDALQSFVRVISRLPEQYEITMLVSTPEEQCKAMQLYHPRIKYSWVSVEEAKKIQQDAHVLFLPLSFRNGSMLEIRTVFATKTLDYLTSGTPILVYSPAESFHSWSASAHKWGYVVSEDSEEALLEGLKKVSTDRQLQEELITHAMKEAEKRKASHYSAMIEGWVNSDKK
jgi:glycosyltransferase involved in cell wall biosynthesis